MATGLLVGWLLLGPPQDGATPSGRERVERVKAQLEALRVRHHVPGLGVAVVHGGRIEWAAGLGVRRTGEPAAVDEKTLFQAASISKPVAAAGALRLVERGDLALDRNVHDYLVSWGVPPAEAANGEAVTLRRLLSHTAGLSVHGFAGYLSSEPAPELLELLDGKKPANSPPIRIEREPGTGFVYSGGGYCVLQQLLLDGSDQEFPELMHDLVLAPLSMARSIFSQPLAASWRDNVASGHTYPPPRALRGDGFVTHPEMAAAGLWTTAHDLALFAIALQESHAGRRPGFLGVDLAREMFTLQPGMDSRAPDAVGYGLGFMLGGSPAHRRFSHGGSNQGFRCRLVAYRDAGLAAAVMTNSDAGGPLLGAALDLIAREYDWPEWRPEGS